MDLARIALVGVLVVAGCGGSRPTQTPGGALEVAPAFPATRWVPASPSYVFAAPTFADAQRGIRDALDGLGIAAGMTAEQVGGELARYVAVNPLDEAAVGSIGVDVHGGVVAFSEDLAPTFVMRLASPETLQGFLDKQRERGMVSRSVIVDGVEVYTAEVVRGELDISWAVADGWLWLHVTPAFARAEGTAWFSNSRRPQNRDWARDWQWAQGSATTGLVGFLDPADVLGRFAAQVPDALACVRLLEPIRRVGLAIDASAGTPAQGASAKGRLSFDLGAATGGVASATLPVPEGFAAAAANAPISAQWNLDLVALRAWAQPCLRTLGEDLGVVDRYGVRAGRAIVQRVDLDDKSGAGVLSLDLVHKRFFANQLDEVPMRSTLERDKRFGPVAGHTIAIPFVATVDYVLEDTLAFVAMGDGLLAKVIGSGARVPGPLVSVDLVPGLLTPQTWAGLLELADLPTSIADRLLRWRDAHLSVSIEGTSLVVAASGTRR